MDSYTAKNIEKVLACVAAVCCLIGIFMCGGAAHVVILRLLLILGLLGSVGVFIVSSLSPVEESWEDTAQDVNGRKVSVDGFRTVVDYVHENIKVMDKFSEEFEANVNEIETEMNTINRAVDTIASNAESQTSETANLSEQMGTVDVVISRTDEQVEALTSATKQMGNQNKKLKQILDDLFKISQHMKVSIDEVHKQTDATNESVEEIKKVIDIISGIATQTNLLSLNASIEAARAGEAGRGFAVVADEVRALAEQSNESAAQIGEIVNTLIDNSNTSVSTMLSVIEEIDNQNVKLSETQETFGALTDEMDSVSGVVTNITDVVETLNTAKGAVMDSIDSLAAIADRNAETSEETSTSLAALERPLDECTKAPQIVRDIADELRRDTGSRF